jgi:acetyl esterase/lipase
MPVIIYIHGGGWMQGSHKGLRNETLAAQGFFTISIEYRLSHQAIFPAQIEDVRDAVRRLHAHADEYHIDLNRIGVWGHSAGGHLASLLGTSSSRDPGTRVHAVMTASGPTDLAQMGGWHNEPDAPKETAKCQRRKTIHPCVIRPKTGNTTFLGSPLAFRHVL